MLKHRNSRPPCLTYVALTFAAQRQQRRIDRPPLAQNVVFTANLAKNVDFGGFDSSIIFILRAGILMSTGDFPESSSQAISVGIMSVERLGVPEARGSPAVVLTGGGFGQRSAPPAS